MSKRGRAWRRDQNTRIIEKRKNIAKRCWFSGSTYDGCHDHYDQWLEQYPAGHLKKHNFTCSCGMCKIEKYYLKYERKQKERKLERQLSEEYSEIIYF